MEQKLEYIMMTRLSWVPLPKISRKIIILGNMKTHRDLDLMIGLKMLRLVDMY